MRTPCLFAALFSLLPAAAFAGDACRFEAPRNLDLDLDGVETLVVDLGRHDLRLAATPSGKGTVRGKACATNEDLLPHLDITQHREGSRLVLTAAHVAEKHNVFVLFGSHYEYLTLDVEIPESLPVELQVGSGDARVDGVARLALTIGSGDVVANGVKGELEARIGSGDLEAIGVGSLRLRSLGSGDAVVERIAGDARVGSVGSGDLELRKVEGNVEIGSVGSGDVYVREVRGSVDVDSLGSGELDARDVGGDFTLHSKGSGEVEASGVAGTTSLPRKR